MARGRNFFVVAFLGIMAGSLVGQEPEEDEWRFRADALLIITIGIVAVVWYLTGQHRYQRSLVPLAAVALLAKALGLILEFKDTVDVGDDYVAMEALLFLVIVAAVVYYRTRAPELEATATRGDRQVPAPIER